MGTKICTKCGAEKELELFKIDKRNKDGRGGVCRVCFAAYSKQYRKDNHEKIVAASRQYFIDNKESRKQYQKDNKERRKQYEKNNAEQIAERYKQYCIDNKEKIAECRKRYAKDNAEYFVLVAQRRNARKKSLASDFTAEQWELCMAYFDHKDAYTGLPLKNPSQDHVIPLSKGGGYTVSNIVPCERSTNSSKKNHDMLTWYRKQTYYDVEREKKILDYLL